MLEELNDGYLTIRKFFLERAILRGTFQLFRASVKNFLKGYDKSFDKGLNSNKRTK